MAAAANENKKNFAIRRANRMENQEFFSDRGVHEKILSIFEKVDEELSDPQKTNMALVDEYLRQVKELDGSPEMTEAELEEGLQEIYRKAATRKKKNFLRRFHTAWGRAACVAAAVLIAFTCSMTVSAVRTPVVNFLTNAYDQFTEIFFDDADIEKAPSTIETVYTLGYVPEGYAKEQFYVYALSTNMTWKNENGDRIILLQGTLGGSLTLNIEESDYTILEGNGKRIAYSQKFGIKSFYWNSEEYEFQLVVPKNMPQEEAFLLIDSVIKYEK
jgi:hypothetical protein